MRAQVAALIEESTIQQRLVDVERENLRVDKEIRDAEWARLEEEKAKFAKEKEAEKRRKEEKERRAERERKKKEREENEKKWERERKEKEERKRKEREEKERKEKEEKERKEKEEKEKEKRKEREEKENEEKGKAKKEAKGKKRKSTASFGWDAGNGSGSDSSDDLNFHFEGRTLPPEMFDLALGARRHQDTAESMNLVVAHMMTARKHQSKLRRKGELPVSLLIYPLNRNSLALRSKPTWFHFSRSGNIRFIISE